MNVEFLKESDSLITKQMKMEADRAAKEAYELELSKREHSVNFLDLIKKCYKDQYGYYLISLSSGFHSGPEVFCGNCKKIIVINDKDITENSFSISLVFDNAMNDSKVLIGRNLNLKFNRVPLSVWKEKLQRSYLSDMPYVFTTDSYSIEEDLHPLYVSCPADGYYRPLTKDELGSFKLIYPSIERIVNGFRKIKELVNKVVDPYIKLNEEFFLEKQRYFKDYSHVKFKYMVNFLENFQPHVHKMFTTCFEKYDSGKKGFYYYLFIGIIGYNNIKLIDPIKNFAEYDYPIVGENEQFVNLMSTVYTNDSGLGSLGVGTGGYKNIGIKFYKDFDDFCKTELDDLDRVCFDSVFDKLSSQVELSAFEDIDYHEVNPTLRYIISKL